MKTGRKSLKDEIQVVKYMTELAPKTFRVIRDMLESQDKKDNKWAAEQMTKLYAKAIPQEFGSDPNNPLIIHISKEVADKNNINESTPDTSDNSQGPEPVQSS